MPNTIRRSPDPCARPFYWTTESNSEFYCEGQGDTPFSGGGGGDGSGRGAGWSAGGVDGWAGEGWGIEGANTLEWGDGWGEGSGGYDGGGDAQ